MKIETILFDLGKVLIDFTLDPLLISLTARCSKPAPQFEKVLRDTELAHRYETGAITTEQFHRHLCEAGGLQMDILAFRNIWCSIFRADLLVSERLLEILSRRYPLILVSNTNEAHAAFIRDSFRVFNYFDHTVFSFEVGSMKPDKKIFERAIMLSGKPPEALFFIDDREENVRGAAEFGIHAHQFQSEQILVRALQDAGVDLGNFVERDSCPAHS